MFVDQGVRRVRPGEHTVTDGGAEASFQVSHRTLELRPLIRRTLRAALGVFGPLGGAAPLFPGLPGPVRIPPVAEDLALLVDGEQDAVAVRLDHPVHPTFQVCEPGHLLRDPLLLRGEGRDRVGVRVIEQCRDLRQGHVELAVDRDALEPRKVRGRVQTVVGPGPFRGGRQADPVPVVEGPHGDAEDLRDLTDGEGLRTGALVVVSVVHDSHFRS